MDRDEILNILRERKEFIKKTYEVDKIGLFGSYVRNENSKSSDIDIYVEFKNKTFDNLAGLWNYLENLYQSRVDLIHKHKNSNRVILENIQREVIFG